MRSPVPALFICALLFVSAGCPNGSQHVDGPATPPSSAPDEDAEAGKALAAEFTDASGATTFDNAADEQFEVRSGHLPGSDAHLPDIMRQARNVVVAAAVTEAEIVERSSAHISTVMDMGGGESISGGGTVTYAYCRQLFTVSEVLAGNMSRGRLELSYGFSEESDAFPGPSQESALRVGVTVILLLGENGEFLKALKDETVNRNAVMAEFDKRDGEI